jgi:hypothetical protein
MFFIRHGRLIQEVDIFNSTRLLSIRLTKLLEQALALTQQPQVI